MLSITGVAKRVFGIYPKRGVNRRILSGEHAGHTPLSLAVFRGDTGKVEKLVEAGANVNKSGALISPVELREPFDTFFGDRGTPLMFAFIPETRLKEGSSWKGPDLGMVNFLLENGADPNKLTWQNLFSPLLFAVSGCSVGGVEILMRYGANPYLRPRRGLSPINLARRNLKGHPNSREWREIVAILESNGVETSHRKKHVNPVVPRIPSSRPGM